MLSHSKKIIKNIKRAAAFTLACGFLCVSLIGTGLNSTKVYAAPSDAVWPEAPEVKAGAAILYESSTGTILYEKNAKEKFYPASTTKLMSALLAIEQCPLSDVVEMSHDAIANVGWDSSRIGMITGEQLSLEDCLYGILLASANEVTYAVAEHVGGSVKEFVKMMQARANELGCVNTHFANPHGLHEEDHYTCAYDLALIMNKCISYTTFCRISHNHYYEVPATNLCESRVIAQTHQILRKKITYDGVFAGKTGHTDEAGQCLVTACERDGLTLVCVVLKEEAQEDAYDDTINLLDYGYNNFMLYTANESEKTEKVNAFPVLFDDEDAFVYDISSALSVSGATLVLPIEGSFSDVENRCELTPLIKLEKGENVIGTANFYYAGIPVGTTNIIYTSENEEIIDAAAVYLQENEGKDTFDQAEYDKLRGILPDEPPVEEKERRPVIVGILAGGTVLIVGIIVVVIMYRRR